jgi:hypothetical protein
LLAHTFIYDPSDLSHTIQNTAFSCSFSADQDGNVFISPTSSEDFTILGYDSDFNPILSVRRQVQQVEKSSEELANESERITRVLTSRNPGLSVEYIPMEHRYVIPPNGLHSDCYGRLWVRSGLSDDHRFEVYDNSGEYLFTAVAEGIDQEETPDVLWWSVSEHGLLAFSIDPFEFPKVYVFDYPEVSR